MWLITRGIFPSICRNVSQKPDHKSWFFHHCLFQITTVRQWMSSAINDRSPEKKQMPESWDPPRLRCQGWWSCCCNPSPFLLAPELQVSLQHHHHYEQLCQWDNYKWCFNVTTSLILLTGIHHSLLDGLWILPWPLLDFLVHLCNLLCVHRPQAAFPLIRAVRWRLLDFLETFIQREIVPHGVFPATRGSFEVWKVFTEKNI